MKRHPKLRFHGMTVALCLIFLLCTATTCEDWEPYYHGCDLENLSQDTIYVAEYSYTGPAKAPSLYTILRNQRRDYFRKVAPGEHFFGEVQPPSEDFVPSTRYQLLVFKQSTIEQKNVEQLIKENRCDKYFDYSYTELQALSFHIKYKGD